VFALIPYDVCLAAGIAVGVELSAIVDHVGLAVVVAIVFGLCAYIVVVGTATGFDVAVCPNYTLYGYARCPNC
jgi:hypothetical protein